MFKVLTVLKSVVREEIKNVKICIFPEIKSFKILNNYNCYR